MTGPLMSLGEPAIASTSRRVPATFAALAAAIVVCWHPGAHAQLSGQVNVYGSANVARLGNSVLVTTTNGADRKHSAIDWNTFSVPKNSFTHFQQPTADSTSINRVTGGKRSDIFGSLSSNGHLVLVNPAGIAFGENSSVDTASFTASTLSMTDEDAVAGRLRFSAGKQAGKLTVDGSAHILARRGDVVLLGTDISIEKPKAPPKPRKDDKDDRDKKGDRDDDKGGKNDRNDRNDRDDPDDTAQVWAPNGSIIIAAGQRIQLTGRGLEGIVLELTSSKDKLVNLGRLEGDAVGLFASQLEHSGIVKAQKVVLQDAKVRLERGGKDDDGKGGKGGKDDDGKGGKDNSGSGNSGSDNSGSGSSGSGSSGSGNSGSGNSGSGSADSGSGSSGSGSGNSGSANSGSGSCTGLTGCTDATLPLGGGTIVIAPVPTAPADTGGTSVPTVPVVVDPAPVVQPVLVTALAAPAAVTTQLSAAVINDYQAPAVTPAQSLDVSRQQDRFAAVRDTPKEDSAAAQCVR